MLKIDLLSVCVKIVAHQFSGKLDIRLFICTNAPLGVQLGVLKSKKKKKKREWKYDRLSCCNSSSSIYGCHGNKSCACHLPVNRSWDHCSKTTCTLHWDFWQHVIVPGYSKFWKKDNTPPLKWNASKISTSDWMDKSTNKSDYQYPTEANTLQYSQKIYISGWT